MLFILNKRLNGCLQRRYNLNIKIQAVNVSLSSLVRPIIRLNTNSSMTSSENELWIRVDFLECQRCTLIEDTLGLQAVVLVEIVFGHALSK